MVDSFIATHDRPLRVLMQDAIGAAVFLLLALGLLGLSSKPGSEFLFMYVPLAMALAVRRIAPLTMMFGTTMLSAVQHVMTGSFDGFAHLITLTSVFSVAAFAQRKFIRYCLVPPVLAIALVLLQTYTNWFPNPMFESPGVQFSPLETLKVLLGLSLAIVFAFVAAWALGMLRRGQLADTIRQRERAVIDERSRISREMHDIIAHSLASIITLAEGGRLTAKQRPELASEIFSKISTAGRDALSDVKVLLHKIDSPQERAPAAGVDAIADLIARVQVSGADTGIVFTEIGERVELSAAVQLALYRVAQESHTNMLKHAPGAHGEIELRWLPDRAQLRAINTLVPGVNPPASAKRGLTGMRERVEMFGGTVEVTRTDVSFEVLATLPIPATEKDTT